MPKDRYTADEDEKGNPGGAGYKIRDGWMTYGHTKKLPTLQHRAGEVTCKCHEGQFLAVSGHNLYPRS